MPEESDRPQDAGRRHARRGIPSAESLELLERYRTALRDELGETLTELRPAKGARPALAQRLKLWDLALKLARELAAGSDVPSIGPRPVAAAPDETRGRAPKLTRRERARLE
jgi:hypothetical protein